jgi:hypothetical protein
MLRTTFRRGLRRLLARGGTISGGVAGPTAAADAPSAESAAAAPSADPSRPTRIVKRSDQVDYIDDLLALIDLKPVRMHEVLACSEPCFYVRHDVDRDLDRALDIAEVEARHGVVSTYFLLTPGSYGEQRNYYGSLEGDRIRQDSMLIEKCRRLIDLGHDLGFHNDLVALSLRTGVSPHELLEREVAFFAEHDLHLVGTAAHGSPLARQLKYNNRELFDGCIRRGWTPGRTIQHAGRSVRLHSLKLNDYGFAYEAYSLPRDSRFSESGTVWGGRIAGERFPKEQMQQRFDLDVFRAFLDRASAEHGVRNLSILTHPCHWDAR